MPDKLWLTSVRSAQLPDLSSEQFCPLDALQTLPSDLSDVLVCFSQKWTETRQFLGKWVGLLKVNGCKLYPFTFASCMELIPVTLFTAVCVFRKKYFLYWFYCSEVIDRQIGLPSYDVFLWASAFSSVSRA